MTVPAVTAVKRPSVAGAPATLRRTLFAGVAILMLLFVANVRAYVIPVESGRADFGYEPSHVSWLQRMLWTSTLRDTITSIFGQVDSATASTKAFTSIPQVTGLKGRLYEYRPHSELKLTDFSLQGDQPDGIAVNPSSGVISGVPTATGKYDMVLAATLGADRRVEQHFMLFIDDRFLVLGADGRGRDILRRLGAAAKYTVVPGIIAVLVGVAGGAMLGAFGGFYGGAAQSALKAITAIIQSVPALLIVFLIGAIFNYNVYVMMVVVGLILLPETANGVFERVESLRKREFVEAARELGMRDRTILWNEIDGTTRGRSCSPR